MAKILTVDDEPLIRKQISRILQRYGHEVHQASMQSEAIQLATIQNFDIALVDYNLPIQNGLEVLQEMRKRQPGCVRILITGMLNEELAVEAVNRGEVSHIVRKPFRNEDLINAVNAAIDTRQRMVEVARVQQEASREDERRILEECLSNDYISLALQPIISTSDSSVIAFEALLRSNHKVLDSPPLVIRAAERHEELGRLSSIIFSLSRRWLEWLEGDFLLFINIHPEELSDGVGMLERLQQLLPWSNRIVLEITERSRLQAIESWEETLDRVTGLGFNIAVDDLGAGYSSLSVLADLQPRYIKMDMSIIHGVDEDPRKRRLVELLCRFADATDAMIVAEGVETYPQASTLRECGAHYLQGYYFDRPSQFREDAELFLSSSYANKLLGSASSDDTSD